MQLVPLNMGLITCNGDITGIGTQQQLLRLCEVLCCSLFGDSNLTGFVAAVSRSLV